MRNNRRVRRLSLPAPFFGRLAITFRYFRTKKINRTKKHRQYVTNIPFLSVREIVLQPVRFRTNRNDTNHAVLSGVTSFNSKYGSELSMTLGLVGILVSVLALNPPPPAPARVKSIAAPASHKAQPYQVTPLARSAPVEIEIPKIGLQAGFVELGLKTDGTMDTPKSNEVVGWYKNASTPGETGPSIIAGHVDSKDGPAIFWRLSELTIGDVIEIRRQDNQLVKFYIDRVDQFSQSGFPTAEVYGKTANPTIRLITCGGVYDRASNRYSHNTVIFATMAP